MKTAGALPFALRGKKETTTQSPRTDWKTGMKKKKKKPKSREAKQAARRERKLKKLIHTRSKMLALEHTNDQTSSKALYDPPWHACSDVSCDPTKSTNAGPCQRVEERQHWKEEYSEPTWEN
jgi:hypothetical protein